jgi:hypothetical protein
MKHKNLQNRIFWLDHVSRPNTKRTLYILACTDKFSKHVRYIPFKKTPDSKTISTKLNERSSSHFGKQEGINTDRGPNSKARTGIKR